MFRRLGSAIIRWMSDRKSEYKGGGGSLHRGTNYNNILKRQNNEVKIDI